MPSWICPAGTMVLLILAPAIFTFATMHSPMVWFGSSISGFVIDLHLWFKMSAARPEDYEAVQEEMGLAKHKFLKHVECRWLSLQPAVLRILEQLEGLKRYFLTVLPEKQPSVAFNGTSESHISFNKMTWWRRCTFQSLLLTFLTPF